MRTVILLISIAVLLQSCSIIRKRSTPFGQEEALTFFRQAQACQIKGRLDSSLYYFNKADSCLPNHAIILHERGLLKSNMRLYKEALIDLDTSIALTNEVYHREVRISNRALVYMEMGDMNAACQDWKNCGKFGKSYLKQYCK